MRLPSLAPARAPISFLVACLAVLVNSVQAGDPVKPATPAAQAKAALIAGNNAKLDNIVIPALKLNQAAFSDAIETIRTAAQDNDKITTDPSSRGINIFVKVSAATNGRLQDLHVTLDLKAASLREVLDAVAKQAGLSLVVEPYAAAYTEQKK